MVMARWQATIVDEAGNIQAGASVRVEHEAAGFPLANLFSDRDGLVPLAGNPFLADPDGFAAFHVLGGAYRITATKGSFSRVWRYVAIGRAAEFDEEDFVGKDANGDASGVRNLDLAGYIDLAEIPTPSSPGGGVGRVYAADNGAGVTTVGHKDSAGNVVPWSHFLQAGTGAVTRTQHAKLRERVGIYDFPVVGDGVEDDTSGVEEAFAHCASTGATLWVPPGRYLMTGRVNVNLTADLRVECDSGAVFVGDSSLSVRLFHIQPTVEYANRVNWRGGSFDVSNVAASADQSPAVDNAGTCLAIADNSPGWSVENVRFIAGADLDNVAADTAVAPENCKSGHIAGCYMRGFSDNAIYVTGGNALDRSQEGGPTFIGKNTIEHCTNGIVAKRGAADVFVVRNLIHRCQNGIGAVQVGGEQNLDPGHHYTIGLNTIRDTVGNPISMRDLRSRHTIVANRIEDWGYDLSDAATASTNKVAIDLRGSIHCQIKENWIGLVERANTPAHRGVTFQNYIIDSVEQLHGGNLVEGNTFEDLDDDVMEIAAGDTANLNIVRNNIHRGTTGTKLTAVTTGAVFYTGNERGIGYSASDGGSVTQLTDKTTGVTLNTLVGTITMNNAALAADALATFTLTNNRIADGDLLLINHISGAQGLYDIGADCNAGSANIYIRNLSGVSRSDAVVLRFAVIKTTG